MNPTEFHEDSNSTIFGDVKEFEQQVSQVPHFAKEPVNKTIAILTEPNPELRKECT